MIRWWHWHSWGKWSEIQREVGHIVRVSNESDCGRVVYLTQQRTCATCGVVQVAITKEMVTV